VNWDAASHLIHSTALSKITLFYSPVPHQHCNNWVILRMAC